MCLIECQLIRLKIINNTKKNEITFHNNRYKGDDPRKKLDKYYSVFFLITEEIENLIKKLDYGEKKILEYGCGVSNYIPFLNTLRSKIFGIDISKNAIKKLSQNFKHLNIKNKINFSIQDCENTNFRENYFDVIFGNGILHHLDLEKSSKELNRILNKNGVAIFAEPLGTNMLINLYRFITPSLRSPDEHPLLFNDFNVFKKYFNNVEIKYYFFLSILAFPFRNFKFFSPLTIFLHKIDIFLFDNKIFRGFFWYSVIILKDPVKGNRFE